MFLQSNGRPSLKLIMQQWNKLVQKQHGVGDAVKPKPLNLTPVSGADLLAPMEATPPVTPEKGKSIPGTPNQQQAVAKRPVIEIVAPPSILTSVVKVAGTPPLKANAMGQQQAANLLIAGIAPPGQQLMIEGPPAPANQAGQQLMIEGPPAVAAEQPGQQQLMIEGPVSGVQNPAVAGAPGPSMMAETQFPGALVGGPPGTLNMGVTFPGAPGFQPMGLSFPPGTQQPLGPAPGAVTGFEALGMAPFVAQPIADFSDLDGFKATRPSTPPPSNSQPLGGFFSSPTGFPASSSASALMDLSPTPAFTANPVAAPARPGTPPPANGNELISLT